MKLVLFNCELTLKSDDMSGIFTDRWYWATSVNANYFSGVSLGRDVVPCTVVICDYTIVCNYKIARSYTTSSCNTFAKSYIRSKP